MPRLAHRLQIPFPSWQEELANAFPTAARLFEFLGLDKQLLPEPELIRHPFPFKVTLSFAEKIQPGNIDDPLLKQILTMPAEFTNPEGFIADPVGDLDALAAPGLLHKYANRVLLILTGACAVHCRYCFRRNYPYSGNQLAGSGRTEALQYIGSHMEIKEVILSGGDPLVLSNQNLEALIGAIASIGHVERLRIHSRIPSVLPSRIDAALLKILRTTRLKTVLVTHINHAQEIDARVRFAVASLTTVRVRVLNQAVLLKGINDDARSLAELFETAFDAGIQPYYLHMLDRAKGAAHFDVPHTRAVELEQTLKRTLPGYLLPRFVREVAGFPYKVPVSDLPVSQ